MRNHYIPILLLALLTSIPALAQQDTQFSQYLFNQLYLNPATAGSDGLIRFQLMHRTQWAGYQGSFDDGGSPSTQLFSAQMPLSSIRSGIGFYATNDRLGPQSNQEIQVSYAYRLPLRGGQLSLGVRGGLYNKSIDFDRLRPREPGDPLIGTGKINETQPDLAVGVYYNASAFFAGVAVNHLLASQYKYGLDRATNPLKSTVYAHGGYRYYLTESVELTPSVLLKSDFTTFSVEGGVLATIQDKYWGGIQYRSNDAVIALIGINLLKDNSLRLGYAFDYVVGGQGAKAPTSHEIMLGYALPAPKVTRRSIVRSPRFRY
ncbi:MAG: type IX secretion system membrane protein PorP/SprF [Cytophagaceae bacterium]|nr:type IX secretion system membrane protein PorP/SprF [Cytophagaceae bacterium]